MIILFTIGFAPYMTQDAFAQPEPELIETPCYGATLELDQDQYFLSDYYHITLVAPNKNHNSDAVETAGIAYWEVGKSKGGMALEETGFDTGIFTTGGVNDRLSPYQVSKHVESAPAQFMISYSDTCTGDLIEDVAEILPDDGPVVEPEPTKTQCYGGPTIKFDQDQYILSDYYYVTVVSPDENRDSDVVETASVLFWAEGMNKGGGTLEETGTDTGIFTNTGVNDRLSPHQLSKHVESTPTYFLMSYYDACTGITVQDHARVFSDDPELIEVPTGTNVVIPQGASVPGCEETYECYFPYRDTISVGETVMWFNQDSEWHTVTAGTPEDGPNGLFDSKKMESGQTFEHTFTQPGIYPYFDMVHPWAIGEIRVLGSVISSSDTTPPRVIVPSDMTLYSGTSGYATLEYDVKAIDDVDGVITPTCDVGSGTVLYVRQWYSGLVTCTATDSAGNTGSDSFMVSIESTPSLYSNVRSTFGDYPEYFVLPVIIDDPDIQDTYEPQGEPDVTVNGKILRMAQTTSGKWYGFFADIDTAKWADSTDLDFGVFCSANTNTSVLGVDFSDTEGVAVPRDGGLSGYSNGIDSFAECTGSVNDSILLNNVFSFDGDLSTNSGIITGQIGLDSDAWPIIQLYDFTDGEAVQIQYNKGGVVVHTRTLIHNTEPSSSETNPSIPRVTTSGDMIIDAGTDDYVILEYDVRAYDYFEGVITTTCDVESGTVISVVSVEQLLVTCTATDSEGNTGSDSFMVTITSTPEPTPESTYEPVPELVEETPEPTPEPVHEQEHEPEPTPESEPNPTPSGTDVVIPRGTGAPGCEETRSCYDPYQITVGRYSTITWFNADSTGHTVTSGSPTNGPDGVFDGNLFMGREPFSHTFDEAGTYEYFCVVHPWMVGKVVVKGTTITSIPTPPPALEPEPTSQDDDLSELIDENRKLREELERQGEQIDELNEEVDLLKQIIQNIQGFFSRIFG